MVPLNTDYVSMLIAYKMSNVTGLEKIDRRVLLLAVTAILTDSNIEFAIHESHKVEMVPDGATPTGWTGIFGAKIGHC